MVQINYRQGQRQRRDGLLDSVFHPTIKREDFMTNTQRTPISLADISFSMLCLVVESPSVACSSNVRDVMKCAPREMVSRGEMIILMKTWSTPATISVLAGHTRTVRQELYSTTELLSNMSQYYIY